MKKFISKHLTTFNAVLSVALVFAILFKANGTQPTPTSLQETRAKYVMYCIRDSLAAELRYPPDTSPEGAAIILGCTDSGFVLYPKE